MTQSVLEKRLIAGWTKVGSSFLSFSLALSSSFNFYKFIYMNTHILNVYMNDGIDFIRYLS